MHGATKYPGGHNDLTAGALLGPVDLIAPVVAPAEPIADLEQALAGAAG